MELYNGNIHKSGEDSEKPQSSKDNETLQDAGHQRDRINVRKAALIAKEKISELMNNAVTILFIFVARSVIIVSFMMQLVCFY